MKQAAILVVVLVYLCATYVNCSCGGEGESCQSSNFPNCCNGYNCKPPEKTCGGVCNTDSCFDGSGINRGIGEKCENSVQCQTPLKCKPPPRTCGGVCAECIAVTTLGPPTTII